MAPSSSTLPPPPPSAEDEFNGLAPPPPPSLKRKREDATRKTPLSVEEILKKKAESDAAKAKPTFMTKAQREKANAEKAAREREEQERRLKAGDKPREEPVINGYAKPVNGVNGTHGGHDSSAVPTGPKAMRKPEPQQNGRPPPAHGAGRMTAKEMEKQHADEEKAAELHRERYMGAAQNQSKFTVKKRRKAEKKFNFSWNAEEDTSQSNALYQDQTEASFFGRGRLGGFAHDEQKAKKYADALERADSEAGRLRAVEILEMERRRREEGRGAIDKHWSEKALERMTERDYRIMKEDFKISTRGGHIPNPLRSWAESNLAERLLELIERNGYSEPSPVQRSAIPCAMAGRDVLAVAQTGSGKTASFLFPLLMYIHKRRGFGGGRRQIDSPYALILAPTRELAQQIEAESRKFAEPLGIESACITGGHAIESDAWKLRNSVDIVIATPGRLVDCIERRVIVLNDTKYLVLDEADKMLDMGFEEPVNRIINSLNISSLKPDTDEAENPEELARYAMDEDQYRTTMMYTATMPPNVERLSKTYLRRPAIVTIASNEASDTIAQTVEMIQGEDKRKKRLMDILNRRPAEQTSAIVFVNVKKSCDLLGRELRRHFATATLHGGKTQTEREAAIESMRNGQSEILCATDVAGRGIDLPDVGLVINFNMPSSIDTYVHRVGRTGRAGRTGTAITFLGNEDADVMYDLRMMLQKSALSKVPDELKKHEAAQQKKVKNAPIQESTGSGGKGGGTR